MKFLNEPILVLIKDDLWSIKLVKRVPKASPKEKGSNWGLCDPSNKTLYIKKALTAEQALETLVHEYLHAIEYEYDMKIPHKLIYALERPIAKLLLDNYI